MGCPLASNIKGNELHTSGSHQRRLCLFICTVYSLKQKSINPTYPLPPTTLDGMLALAG